jgi:hypothetical protein
MEETDNEDDNEHNNYREIFRHDFFDTRPSYQFREHESIRELDPTCDDEGIDVQIYQERNIARCKYAKSIVEYEVGTRVSKHCAPWGENTLLCNESFILSKLVYRSNGRISSVVISARESGYQYLLGPAFFLGWCDREALDKYFDKT